MKRSNESEEECPSNSFEQGEPGGECWSDGHHLCDHCIHLRPDFKGEGREVRNELLQQQNGLNVLTIKTQ